MFLKTVNSLWLNTDLGDTSCSSPAFRCAELFFFSTPVLLFCPQLLIIFNSSVSLLIYILKLFHSFLFYCFQFACCFKFLHFKSIIICFLGIFFVTNPFKKSNIKTFCLFDQCWQQINHMGGTSCYRPAFLNCPWINCYLVITKGKVLAGFKPFS